jgi:hypothetical protein
MSSFRRAFTILAVFLLSSTGATAATQRQVDEAVEKGVKFLKSNSKGGGMNDAAYGIGPTALAGLALLEAKVPAADPAIQAIAKAVREASYRETKTYQLSLCLLFLDKLEDPADVPMIQVLAVRLLAGQTNQGGWTYDCIDAVPQADEKSLRAGLKAQQLVTGDDKERDEGSDRKGQRVGRLHPDVEKYAAALWARRGAAKTGDDNSNTQFAVLAVWASRKHGVPVESALDAIEKRFVASQDRQTGGWAYSGGAADGGSSPAMTCAGLIGLSVGVARREEQRMKAETKRKEKGNDPKANDPFFNPPPRPNQAKPKKAPKRQIDPRNIPVQRGLQGLGVMFAGQARGGREAFTLGSDLYFLWSLERVAVIYGVDKIGGLDWYAVGSDALVRTQSPSGAWSGGYGETIDTSFAILFLVRANIARDLSSRVQRDPSNTELRSGPAPGTVEAAPEPSPMPRGGNTGTTAVKPLPLPMNDAAGKLAGELLAADSGDWTKKLELLRDSKGGDHTRALTLAIPRLDGERKSQARDALAERLTRMTAATLRTMMKSKEAELRRAAVLAGAMKDDRAHVPDLIDRLTDEEDLVVRAAAAGLKSLSRGKDFGPDANATKQQKQAAADAWRAWWLTQK